MLEIRPKADLVEIQASGRLTGDDYERFVPELERLASERGPLRLYIELNDFRGWDAKGLWKDLEFDVKHQDDMQRIAIVGDKAWEEWGTKLSKPFFKADMRYFTPDEAEAARQWVGDTRR